VIDCGIRIADCGLNAARRRGVCVFAVLATLCVGCGQPTDGIEVTGTVTHKGQPLSNAAITFFPTQGRPTTVPLDVDGDYVAKLEPGDYRVTVTVGVSLPEGYKEGDPLPPPTVVLPDRYTHRAKTELAATVAEDQSEPIDFALE
jgi:hypothetical protein